MIHKTKYSFQINVVFVLNYPIELGFMGYVFAAFWLLGCINAINLLDGMDGLVGSFTLIASITIAILAVLTNQILIALIALALAGCIIGFLRYNLPPARIYLGDCGSMLLGLLIGALALQGGMKSSTALTIFIPIGFVNTSTSKFSPNQSRTRIKNG